MTINDMLRRESRRRIKRLLKNLLAVWRFFGHLALRLDLIEDAKRKTIAADGRAIRYSPNGSPKRMTPRYAPPSPVSCSRARSSTTPAEGIATTVNGSGRAIKCGSRTCAMPSSLTKRAGWI